MDNLFTDILPTQDGAPAWEKEWVGMPEFKQLDMEPWKSIVINFETEKDMLDFAKLVDQKITFKTPSIWWPKADRVAAINQLWIDEPTVPNIHHK